MFAKLARTGALIAAIGVAGCNDSSMKDFAPEANKPLPDKILADMKAKGMVRTSSVMARIFKEEGKLEIWKAKTNGRYDLVASYDICKWSGKLGPKFTEGDRQAPEGFYTVRPQQMNPRSNYHLSFNIGYPNAYDRANGRTGSNLMVHGACSSSGCYSMTDAQIEQIYAFGRDAFQGGQTEFQIEAFPFRMTPANMARYRNDPNYDFWKMLKVGYDNFEITKVPPKVDVCEKRYVFNQVAPEGTTFDPTGPCPASTQPEFAEERLQRLPEHLRSGVQRRGQVQRAGAQADDCRHQGSQHRFRLVEAPRPRRARADRSAVAQLRRYGDRDGAHGPHRFAGRPQDGRARRGEGGQEEGRGAAAGSHRGSEGCERSRKGAGTGRERGREGRGTAAGRHRDHRAARRGSTGRDAGG